MSGAKKLLIRLAQCQHPLPVEIPMKSLNFEIPLSLTVSLSFLDLQFKFYDIASPSLTVTIPCARR